MRAFVYCRVSTQEQACDDHYSLGNQEQRCREYIKHKSWQLVKVLKDVASGKSAQRESYQELLRAIREHRVDVVVVYRLDRLSRSVVDIYNSLDLFRTHTVGFVSVQEAFDTTTAMGRAMLGVAAVFAQLTREMISENTKDGLARRAQAGKYVGGGATTPYGYRLVEGKLEVMEPEAEVVRRVYRMYTDQGWGPGKIAAVLNQDNVPTRQGLQGHWRPMAVGHMLRNPAYAGRIRMNDNNFSGEHEAIISEELFAATQSLIEERSKLAPRGRSSPHLLSGIARCGTCGWRLGIHQTLRGPGKPAYLTYRHPPNHLKGEKACLGVNKSAHRLEELVVAEVRRLAQSPELRRAALAEAEREVAAKVNPLAAEREELLATLASGEQAFDQWADRLSRGLIDEEQFARLNQAHLEDKRKARERLAKIEVEASEGGNLAVSLAEVEQVLEDFNRTWEEMSGDERREVMRSLVEYLKVYPDHAELKLIFQPEVRLDLSFGRSRGREASAAVGQA
jgi:site-specific DNA recombinase